MSAKPFYKLAKGVRFDGHPPIIGLAGKEPGGVFNELPSLCGNVDSFRHRCFKNALVVLAKNRGNKTSFA